MILERLDNGLPVIVKSVPNKVVTIDCWVNTGSANENEDMNGISHFLEHMMFKGTPKYGPGELDKAIMNVGGVWNAGTSKDFTHYHVTVAAPFFDTALDAISDMMQNSLIDAGEFEREKQVILEEYRRKQDSPIGVLFDELYDAHFNRSPYKLSVLGSFESISSLDRDAMYDYYQRYYAPQNMVVIVVGDISPANVVSKIRDAFEKFDRPFEPLDAGERQTEFATNRIQRLKKDVNELYAGFAFPGPPISQAEEVFALDLASTILGEGRSSRLYQRLKEEKRLVNSVSCGFPTHRYESVFYIFATASEPRMEPVQKEMQQILQELAETPPPAEELAKAKQVITNDFHYHNETNTGQTGTIGYYYTLTASTDFLEQYVDRIRAVTADEVSSVVRRYLTAEPNLVLIEPENGKAPTEHAGAPQMPEIAHPSEENAQ